MRGPALPGPPGRRTANRTHPEDHTVTVKKVPTSEWSELVSRAAVTLSDGCSVRHREPRLAGMTRGITHDRSRRLNCRQVLPVGPARSDRALPGAGPRPGQFDSGSRSMAMRRPLKFRWPLKRMARELGTRFNFETRAIFTVTRTVHRFPKFRFGIGNLRLHLCGFPIFECEGQTLWISSF